MSKVDATVNYYITFRLRTITPQKYFDRNHTPGSSSPFWGGKFNEQRRDERLGNRHGFSTQTLKVFLTTAFVRVTVFS